jgi:hypothetical protein
VGRSDNSILIAYDDILKRLRFAISGLALPFAVSAIFATSAVADNFANVYYDGRTDRLVVTIFYRGTNPDHVFSLQWGDCKNLPGDDGRQIVAEVLDNQWKDDAVKNFKKTSRFSLENLQCRPATLTLRTAPRFYYTLQIPARATPQP